MGIFLFQSLSIQELYYQVEFLSAKSNPFWEPSSQVPPLFPSLVADVGTQSIQVVFFLVRLSAIAQFVWMVFYFNICTISKKKTDKLLNSIYLFCLPTARAKTLRIVVVRNQKFPV